jgi:hypothetical protein
LHPATAQDATPVASPTADPSAIHPEFLFLQSFASGTVAPKEGAEGTYTLTLQHGLGQTVYFSDRPERIVGVVPTTTFLDGLGFSPHNPPNAALVIDSDEGAVDIAVVELSNPAYDEATATATYDISVLQDYADVDLQFQQAPADLATIAANFGSAHLFIDDCDTLDIACQDNQGRDVGEYTQDLCWVSDDGACEPCTDPNDACGSQFRDYCYTCTQGSPSSCQQWEYTCTWTVY